jgi:glycosyltransferase involved in cell wall biosynthesis
MRILMTADAIGGVWQYATDLAEALTPLGVETLLAVLGPSPDDEQRAQVAAIAGVTLVDTGLPLDWLCDGPAPMIAAGRAIAALARRERVDLVQANMPTLAAGGDISQPVVAVAHGCIGTWWRAAHGEVPGDRYAWLDAINRVGLQTADVVVAPSASHADAVTRHHTLEVAPLVVHNGRAPLPLPADIPPTDAVFTAGRLWDLVKETPMLDRVAARLPVPFRAAGAVVGPHGERADIAYLKVLGQLGPDGLARELAARPIFVSAARFEPFGLAVLEAAQAGCPLILSNIDTFRELWTGAALLVEEDEEAYVAAITRVRADAGLRAHLSEAARLRAQRYTPAATAGAMAALYAGLVTPSAKVAA